MDAAEKLKLIAYTVGLGLFVWWVLRGGGDRRLDGSLLGAVLMHSIPKSRYGWNADSWRLYAVSLAFVAAIWLIVRRFAGE